MPGPNEGLRNKILTAICIVCGSIAAGILFRMRFAGQAPITDEQARSLGYSSADDERDTQSLWKSYWEDAVRGRFSDAEFLLAKKTLGSGSRAARHRIIIAFGHLQGLEQHAKVLDLLPQGAVEDRGLWASSFRRWIVDGHDPNAIHQLLASKNPNAEEIAKEIQNEHT